LHKKLAAVLTIAIFLLGSVAMIAPASAHFTLGDYTNAYPFHMNDVDTNPAHVAGPLAYVWPGGGLGSFSGPWSKGAPEYPAFPPGYQSPWPHSYPAGQGSSVYELEGSAYAPFGAILTSTPDHANRGPLIFAINFTNPCANPIPATQTQIVCSSGAVVSGPMLNYTAVTVYVPPEFDLTSAVTNPGLIMSSFGQNSYDMYITQTNMQDPVGPGWWMVTFYGDIHFWPQHNYQEWYYMRINDAVAPQIAGKYFFKMFLWDDWEMSVPGAWNTASQVATAPTGGMSCNNAGQKATGMCLAVQIPPSGPTALTVPVENWPVLLVKGEIDPGIITGSIRYGTFNQTMYGRPVNVPGKVWATGVANDPYTAKSTGRKVTAMGYFNASATGHYEVEGVAPGVYDIYAQAAGFPAQKVATGITILPGQSFHLDCYVNPGAVVHGQVFSKHLFGVQPWPSQPRPVLIELYSANDYKDSSVVAWSPWNKTHPGYMAYDWPEGSSVPNPYPVAYDWDARAPFALSYYSNFFAARAAKGGYYTSHPAIQCGGINDYCGKPDGVGPAQYWWVDDQGVFTNGGGNSAFTYAFGVKGVYGAPTNIDGHVPQPMATWVNGLTAGRYWVRAWINGYTQTLQDGVTLDEYYFDVNAQEWAGDVFMPMDLRVSSFINKTVHFHDQPGTLAECPIFGCGNNAAQGNSATKDRYLIAEAYDSNGKLAGMNVTVVNWTQSNAAIEINGFGMMGPEAFGVLNGVYNNIVQYPGMPTAGTAGSPPFKTTTPIYAQPKVSVDGVSAAFPANYCTYTDCSGMKFSYYRYVAAGGVLNGYTAASYYNANNMARDYGLPSGTYTVHVYMRGYVQQTFESVSVTLSGSPAIISNHMYRGARFNVTFYSIDWEHPRVQKPWDFPGARIRAYVYDQAGRSFSHVGTRAQPTTPFADTSPPGGFAGAGQEVITGSCNLLFGELADHCRVNEYEGNTNTESYLVDYYEIQGYVPIETLVWGTGGLLENPSYYRFSDLKPSHGLESGTYCFYGYTYGYIQAKDFCAYAPKGGFGDIKINLLIGVNITLNIPFKKEGIYSPTAYNMTMHVRVFDDSGLLIGKANSAAMDTSAVWTATGPLGQGRCLGVTKQCVFQDYQYSSTLYGGRAQGSSGYGSGNYGNYIDPFGPAPNDGYNAITSVDPSVNGDTFLWYGNYGGTTGTATTWQAFDSNLNNAANTAGGTTGFSFFDYNTNFQKWRGSIPAGTQQVRVSIAGAYDAYSDALETYSVWGNKALKGGTYTGKNDYIWYGIPGFSSTIPNSYSGKYTVEVDTINNYPTPTWVNGVAQATNWFPSVEGLLEGESFHTIPGSVKGPFGYAGSSLAANGLGPYAQTQPWIINNGHLGSEVSAIFELDKRGYIAGNIYGFTWSDELRTQSWITVQAAAATGNLTFLSYSWDSQYNMYLDPGSYNFRAIAWTPTGNVAYNAISSTVNISTGQSTAGVTFQLERSNIPVPEFSGLAIIAFSALAASLYLLRRRRP